MKICELCQRREATTAVLVGIVTWWHVCDQCVDEARRVAIEREEEAAAK